MNCNSALSSKIPNFISVVSMWLLSFWKRLEKQSMNKQPALSVQYYVFKCKAKSLLFLNIILYNLLILCSHTPFSSLLFLRSSVILFAVPFLHSFTSTVQFKCRQNMQYTATMKRHPVKYSFIWPFFQRSVTPNSTNTKNLGAFFIIAEVSMCIYVIGIMCRSHLTVNSTYQQQCTNFKLVVPCIKIQCE